MKLRITLANVKSYIEGTLRYNLFYSKWWVWLIRPHIYQQIQLRIIVMDKDCYDSGACKLCGCSTTALQMAQKACDKPCYPPMMNRRIWKRFKKGFMYPDDKLGLIWLYINENRIECFNLEDYVGKSNH